MYVQCERCKTEYDFDDALVSERGTTVKCTQCGHQFKVRRGAAHEGGTDRWVVTTVSGKTLVFTSLRELQKAILGKQVARSDSLSRGTGTPRLLGAIAELEPFFDKRASVPPPKDVEPQTHRRPSTRPPGASAPLNPPRPRIDTLRPETGASAPPAASPRAASALATTLQNIGQPPTAEPFVPRPVQPQPEPSATIPAFIPSAQPPQPVAPPPQEQVHRTVPIPPAAQTPAPAPAAVPVATRVSAQEAVMSSPLPPPTVPHRSYHPAQPSIPPDDTYAQPRRRVGGWVVALVLVAGVSVIGFLVVKSRFLHGPAPAASLAPLDPKAQKLLSDGEHAFADGDLDAAKEDFDKASVLADKDPRVLLDVARVDEARADVAWLAERIAADGEAHTRARKDLDELSVKSSAAADAALGVAKDDPAAVRSKIDALRIAGDLAQARALVPKMQTSAISSQPETEYVLAALDLADTAPPTPQVLERLREAAASEGNLGRARAALVYALARTGDAAGARKELEKLLGLPHQHPLQSDLRALVDHTTQAQNAGDAGAVAVVDVNALPSGHPTAGGPVFGAADPRTLNQEADTARQHGDYQKAKALYGKVLEKNPTDSEALSGLGDCAFAQRDLENAKTYYKRALAANNTFTPALIGLADALWETGDHADAQKRYKDIVDRLPDSIVPARVKQRAQSAAPAPTATATATGSAAPESTE
jgi:predicted Zn finger-like uncharacterized protein